MVCPDHPFHTEVHHQCWLYWLVVLLFMAISGRPAVTTIEHTRTHPHVYIYRYPTLWFRWHILMNVCHVGYTLQWLICHQWQFLIIWIYFITVENVLTRNAGCITFQSVIFHLARRQCVDPYSLSLTHYFYGRYENPAGTNVWNTYPWFCRGSPAWFWIWGTLWCFVVAARR